MLSVPRPRPTNGPWDTSHNSGSRPSSPGTGTVNHAFPGIAQQAGDVQLMFNSFSNSDRSLHIRLVWHCTVNPSLVTSAAGTLKDRKDSCKFGPLLAFVTISLPDSTVRWPLCPCRTPPTETHWASLISYHPFYHILLYLVTVIDGCRAGHVHRVSLVVPAVCRVF